MTRLIMTALLSVAVLATAGPAMSVPSGDARQATAEAGSIAPYGVWQNGYGFDAN